MPRNVAIVFDADFSSRLEKIAFRAPVWIVDTPANHIAAEEAWHAAHDWPHISVTLFRAPDGPVTKDDWLMLLEQISFHERNVESIDVFGSPLTLVARATLAEAGFGRFEETADGFRAKR